LSSSRIARALVRAPRATHADQYARAHGVPSRAVASLGARQRSRSSIGASLARAAIADARFESSDFFSAASARARVGANDADATSRASTRARASIRERSASYASSISVDVIARETRARRGASDGRNFSSRRRARERRATARDDVDRDDE
jgi:hypothetical protein